MPPQIIELSGDAGEKDLAIVLLESVGPNQWHNLRLRFDGATITGFVDGKAVVSASDSYYARGMAGLMAGGVVGSEWQASQQWQHAETSAKQLSMPYFANMLINGVNAPAPEPTSVLPNYSPIYSSRMKME